MCRDLFAAEQRDEGRSVLVSFAAELVWPDDYSISDTGSPACYDFALCDVRWDDVLCNAKEYRKNRSALNTPLRKASLSHPLILGTEGLLLHDLDVAPGTPTPLLRSLNVVITTSELTNDETGER